MAKIVLSSFEFELITDTFRAPKEGKHVKWREFCDSVDEVFTKKELEKAIDTPLEDARTQTFYGRTTANKKETNLSDDVVQRVR